MDTRMLNIKFCATQIQIPLPNKYLGVGYKGFVFCRNNGWIMENMDMELTVYTKIGADSLARNTPNAKDLSTSLIWASWKVFTKWPIIYLLNLFAQAQKFRISMIFANILQNWKRNVLDNDNYPLIFGTYWTLGPDCFYPVCSPWR